MGDMIWSVFSYEAKMCSLELFAKAVSSLLGFLSKKVADWRPATLLKRRLRQPSYMFDKLLNTPLNSFINKISKPFGAFLVSNLGKTDCR